MGDPQILQEDERPTESTLRNATRFAMVTVFYLAISTLLRVFVHAPLTESSEVLLRPDVALAALVIILFGWSYLPVALLDLALDSSRTINLGGQLPFVVSDTIACASVAIGTAYCVRRWSPRGNWGCQRDLFVLAGCVGAMPF